MCKSSRNYFQYRLVMIFCVKTSHILSSGAAISNIFACAARSMSLTTYTRTECVCFICVRRIQVIYVHSYDNDNNNHIVFEHCRQLLSTTRSRNIRVSRYVYNLQFFHEKVHWVTSILEAINNLRFLYIPVAVHICTCN